MAYFLKLFLFFKPCIGRSGGIGIPACRQAGALVLNDPMYIVYAIGSLVRNYIYVGLTNNFKRRFSQHSLGKERTTRAYRPFKVIYKEPFNSRIEAREKEKYLKSGVGKEFLKTLLFKA